MAQFLDLPEEVLFIVMSYLSEANLFRLGSCCRYLHVLIHQNDFLWRKRAERYGVKVLDTEKLDGDTEMKNCRAIVYDRSIRGYKELCLLRSSDYRSTFRAKLVWGTCISNYIAMVGPGIDSRNNSDIIRKIFDRRNERFRLKVNDQHQKWKSPGSAPVAGVWLVFDFRYEFILGCLHINDQTARESLQGSGRLQTRFNKLLSKDIPINNESTEPWEFLQKGLVDVFGSVNSLVYTIDVSPDVNLSVEMQHWKCEFDAFMGALNKSKTNDVPLMFLCMFNDHGQREYVKTLQASNFIEDIYIKFNLQSLKRPLGVFLVNTKNTEDIETSFEWLLYRMKKEKAELVFHQSQAKRIF